MPILRKRYSKILYSTTCGRIFCSPYSETHYSGYFSWGKSEEYSVISYSDQTGLIKIMCYSVIFYSDWIHKKSELLNTLNSNFHLSQLKFLKLILYSYFSVSCVSFSLKSLLQSQNIKNAGLKEVVWSHKVSKLTYLNQYPFNLLILSFTFSCKNGNFR